MKKILKVLGILLLVVILAAAGLILWLSVTEFKPAPVESVESPLWVRWARWTRKKNCRY